MLSRRRLLWIGGGVVAGLSLFPKGARSHGRAASHAGSPKLQKFVDPLPRLDRALKPSGIHEGSPLYEIAMRAVRQRLHRDLPPTPLWAYAGQFPGPTLDVRTGQRIFVRWVNEIPDGDFLIPQAFDAHLHGTHHGEPPAKTVVHLHGAVVAPDSDGRPDAWFTSGFGQRGAEWTREIYEYPNQQDACLLWYHDHAIGQTRLNVYAGLAGAYLIRDDHEDALGLPGGDHEVLLMIQDRSFAADGSLTYPIAESAGSADRPGPWVPEFFGDTILVNGKVWPHLEVEPRKYRLRILNGSNARFYQLRLADGRSFLQIGTDQGLLPSPVEVRRLLLAPAERADVIVDFRGARGSIRLLNDAPTPYPNGEAPDRRTTANVMEFRVGRRLARPDTARIPDKLRAVAPLPEREAKVRYMAFSEYKNVKGEPTVVLLNGRKWDAPVTIQCKAGDTEVWHLINPTEDTHPIHLHLVRFQVLDRQKFDSDDYLKAWNAEIPGEGPDPISAEPYLRGSRIPPPPQERGWKDTVRVDPGEVIRIIARFDGVPGKYPWHCHVLEHEDNEMMLQFELIP
ncbi:multicopper oxidase domain-containing protein [Bradyrhizobium sediminis]|uniref:Multicopper oxidase domain-containing protein n=1 Tax=Bradyrhizobium sediminis TaxID=2840469 RepID=A0A975P135_9BRAD|nr:multicopper oxidase domain-containing protein [Bradyrhizobium sediminis]QWG24665.1 multicopper oxidase domain-containing protein [Bradyrhizobium sediminis]